MKKLTLIAAAAAGYVLGTRAGRERYEQIKTQATNVWNNPKVQDVMDDVQTQAKHAGSEAGSKVASTASDVASKVTDKVADKTSGSNGQPPVDDTSTAPLGGNPS
ncbi:YtxH domain-containing protein [Aeromicrobium sp. SMF47]|uniref:YtxH domain-containing protein n=1 Tax=Aeromicrobium yanjiei TaxID=2662028 RepID=A0A5Q2MFX4_9ACTN|nr:MULTISPECIES: YtxH domain-containing protein [Aeromicrobium]MRJ75639.1 YtxH domain-containing protein [Aeromicrobium yanjiei]MRJ99983.1 YtxH domain-containing protein [Aeromicrobium sp. S22]QGG39942.1 YtxH domain-containing protein [Aeromicrobium yanjiei]